LSTLIAIYDMMSVWLTNCKHVSVYMDIYIKRTSEGNPYRISRVTFCLKI